MPDPTYTNSKVYMEQGASALVVKSGGHIRVESGGNIDLSTSTGTLTLATGQINAGHLAGNLSSGSVDLGVHLFNARELSSGENVASGTSAPSYFWGGLLYKESTPSITTLSTGDQTFTLQWASNNVDGIKLPPIALPADFSTAGGVRLDILGESVGTGTASDAIAAVQIKAWCGVGGADLGTTHPNFTSTPTYQTISLSTGNLATTVLNLTLIPQAHAARAINVYGLRMRYNRTS